MTDTPTAKPRRTPLWVKLLFGVSLALNLAVVGMVAGVAMRDGPGKGKGKDGGPRSAMVLVTALEKEQRRAILRSARAGRDGPRGDRRADMQEILGLLAAETLDVDALRIVLDQQSERGAMQRAKTQEAYIAVIKDMSPEARAAYVARLQDRLSKRRFKD